MEKKDLMLSLGTKGQFQRGVVPEINFDGRVIFYGR